MKCILGIDNIEILTEQGKPALFFSYPEYAVPVAVAGAGAEWLSHLALSLSLASGGLALVEEPEVHLHPGGIREAARVVWGAVRSAAQVVVSTHSLDLIDWLVSEANDDSELEQLSLFQLTLREGVLISSRVAGTEVSFLRATIAEDLR